MLIFLYFLSWPNWKFSFLPLGKACNQHLKKYLSSTHATKKDVLRCPTSSKVILKKIFGVCSKSHTILLPIVSVSIVRLKNDYSMSLFAKRMDKNFYRLKFQCCPSIWSDKIKGANLNVINDLEVYTKRTKSILWTWTIESMLRRRRD